MQSWAFEPDGGWATPGKGGFQGGSEGSTATNRARLVANGHADEYQKAKSKQR